jgi:DNA-binding winged helix-turn-helix (wHTH) protein/Flp pilus assembly protein TadD
MHPDAGGLAVVTESCTKSPRTETGRFPRMADITFGPFTLDISATRLLRDGVDVKLRPQALLVLRALLRHGGETVGYDQMIADAWGGTMVSRHTVDVTVGEVKKSLAEYGTWIVNRPKLGYRLQVPTSDEDVRKGWHFWARRTREGFELAIEAFTRVAADCPADFRAFEGLSASYLMLATFGMRPPREMYPRFLDAQQRAIELGVWTADLRCNHAHALHMFERRVADAEAEFLATLQDDPHAASTLVRLARLYATLGRTDEALEVLKRGYQADPLLPTLPVMEVLVRIWRREFDLAISVATKAVELHPYLQIAKATYGQALEYAGRLDEALAQYQAASRIGPELSWLRAHEGICLAKQERTPEALTVLQELEQRREREYVDACYMAWLRAALGQRDEAFQELVRAGSENSAWLHSMDVDPNMDEFRGDLRFQRLRDQVFRYARRAHAVRP